MLINCSRCSARVDAKVEKNLAVYKGNDEEGITDGYRVTLMECPACHIPLVGKQEMLEYGDDDDSPAGGRRTIWSSAKRVWPESEAGLDASIPEVVRISLDEAKRCLSGATYTASVVMSGRALEAVARHFHVAGKADRLMLAKGLEELHDNGKIDERLYQWGKELHEHRNLAAHASERTFSREDAQDLYEFVNAICDYLFVLQDRYDRFMQRKATQTKAVAQ